MPSKSSPSWRRQLRYYYLRLLRLQSTPRAIARGLAVGIFAGCFPIFGFQTLAALSLAVVFKGNKLVAALGTLVSNPLTYVPIYFFNYRVGRWILGSSASATALAGGNLRDWMTLGFEVVMTLFVGCTFIGAILSVVGYFSGLKLARILQDRRRTRSIGSRL